jgi:hypothetical protein
METTADASVEPTREQVIYANMVIVGVWVGMALLFVTFGLYVFGVLEPYVPLEETPRNWGQGVTEYLEKTHWPTGWSWTGMLGRGDILNYVGFVLLAMLTVVGYSFLLVVYSKKKDRLFATICLLEILILMLAASGVLTSGGH